MSTDKLYWNKLSRILASTTHIGVSIFQLSFIYTPLHDVPHMFSVVQWVSTPLLFITGFWLVMGRRQYAKAIAAQNKNAL